MAVTFRRCPTVKPGERITSTHLAGLARALNDRMRSGLGDPTWRLWYYLLGLTRQIRNSDGGALFPPQAEFFEVYQQLSAADAQWPTSLAGEAEGVNVANPLGCFVFGRESANIDAEPARIASLTSLGTSGSTLSSYWALAKAQRGAVDPSTGAISCPALDAARLHKRIAYNIRAPYANSYGGFLPIPQIAGGSCAPVDGIEPVNYEIKFTSIADGSEIVYPGTCPEEPTHVAYVLALSDIYVVVLNDGSADFYRRNEWIEGPYTGGGSLRRAVGGQLDRVVDRYAKDFRGTDEQRKGGRWNSAAFDFQAFLTRQYSLAPQRGHSIGEDELAPDYPTFSTSTDRAPGFEWPTAHAYQSGYVLDSFFVYASNLESSCTVELVDQSGAVVAAATVTPNSARVGEALAVLRRPVSPQSIRPRLPSGVRFVGGAGSLSVELTELYPYKPDASDAYLLLRASSTQTTGATVGSGLDETRARQIWTAYRDRGVILTDGDLPEELVTINTNAVFDAARRMTHCVRILSRQQLIGYALEDGKSVLWFRRLNSIGADSFRGIAAPREGVTSGNLVRGRSYSSRSGPCWYDGNRVEQGVPFIATGSREFSGPAVVYEHDGIRHTAPPGGYTNEWLVGFQFKAYHPSESSIWKPSSFSDYFALSERCHFYHSPTYPTDLRQQFNYGATLALAPESPTGYRYAKGTNIISCDPLDTPCVDYKVARYKSCRIYEPDVEVEKAEVVIEGGEEVVKVTLTGRLHHSDDAVSTIARDPSTWNVSALRAEAFRSNENAVREYLLNQYNGTNAVAGKPGDSAASSTVDFLPDNPHGTVYPSIFFTQLIPSPYEDENDAQNPKDTAFANDIMTQAELYLRAFCEGYVDGKTTEEYACASGISSVYDYTFENLCFDASRRPWLTAMPTEETDEFGAAMVRPEGPQGFGPHPNTKASAEVWNQFANAVNLLTRVRVMIPYQLEARTLQDSRQFNVTNVTQADGAAVNCPGTCDPGFVWVGDPGDVAATTVTSGWSVITPTNSVFSTWDSLFAVTGANYLCDGSAFVLGVSRLNQEYRYQLVDPDAEHAIPEAWRSQLQEDGEFLVVQETTTERTTVVYPTASPTLCAGGARWSINVGGVDQDVEYATEAILVAECKIVPATGFVEAPAGGEVVMIGADCSPICTELDPSGNSSLRNITRIQTDSLILNVPLV